MGRGEREAVTDGSGNSAQNRNFMEDVSDKFGSFFRKAKTKVEEQVRDIDTDQIKDQAGRIGQEIQGRAQREVEGVRRDVEQAQKGNPNPLINRGIDAGIKAGSFGLAGGVTGEVAKRFGLGDKLGGFLGKGVEEITRVDTAGFVEKANTIFDRVDANKDGFMELSEIEEAKKDKVFWAQYAFTLKYLGDKYETLQNLNNDEWFREDNGVSKDDINALSKALKGGTGFGAGIGRAFDDTWDTTWKAGVVGVGTGVGHAFLKGGASSRIGLIAGGIAFAGGFAHDSIDYMWNRKAKLETTIKDLG